MRVTTARLIASSVAGVLLLPASILQASTASAEPIIDFDNPPPAMSDPTPRVETGLDAEGREINRLTNAEVRELLKERPSDQDPGGAVESEPLPDDVVARATSTYKFYDSQIPTYNYVRFYFNKRATYLVGTSALATATLVSAIAGFIPVVYARAAAAVLAVGSTAVGLKARNAQNDGQCLAFSFYIRKSAYWGANLPGPEVAPRSIYQTSLNCTGRYRR